MVFSSFIFISVFLPLVLAGYFLAPRKLRNVLLLVFSVLFYSWGEAGFLWVMLAVVAWSYLGALVLDSRWIRGLAFRGILLAVFIGLILMPLAHFKYAGFIRENVGAVLGWGGAGVSAVVLPLGISFYTFQALSYLIDVFRGEVPAQRNPLDLALYIAFFPQLVAGPILKYHDIHRQIAVRRESMDLVIYGTRRFCIGFAKKILIANTMAGVADAIFNASPTICGPISAWGGGLAYTMQIYYDFSGYSDMAIGLGAIFGFRFQENFQWPYAATSITDFWRRWHISLSTWFRDYLYIPMGGNRGTHARTIGNLLLVFLVTGLWHGAAWTFVVWGVWHGLFIALERIASWSSVGRRMLSAPVYRMVTVLVIVIGWVVFRSDDLTYAVRFVGNMFGLAGATPVRTPAYYFNGLNLSVLLLATIGSLGGLGKLAQPDIGSVRVRFVGDVFIFGAFALSLVFLAGSTNNPFIYFRF